MPTVSYKTAWLRWKQGKLPVPARQTSTATILLEMPERKGAGAVLDARVSSADEKADRDRQVARLRGIWAEKGICGRVAGNGLSVLRSPE